MVICYVVLTFGCLGVLLFLFLELNYFLRMSLCVLVARFLKKKIHILQETTVHGKMTKFQISTNQSYYSNIIKDAFNMVPIININISGLCLTTDIDTFLYHMNNARFIRELDFARADFYERTGLYKCVKSKGGTVAMGATTVRYRRFIRLFHRYMITSKVIT